MRIANRFDIDGSCILVDRRGGVLRVLTFDELAVNVELLHVYSELVKGSTVQIHGIDEFVAWFGHGSDRHKL